MQQEGEILFVVRAITKSNERSFVMDLDRRDEPKAVFKCDICNSSICEGDDYKQLENGSNICIACSFFIPEKTITVNKVAKKLKTFKGVTGYDR